MTNQQLLIDARRKRVLKETVELADKLVNRASDEINANNSSEHNKFAAYVFAAMLDLKVRARLALEDDDAD